METIAAERAPRLTEPAPGAHKSYIDALRLVAMFLVIVNHTNSELFLNSGPSLTWYGSLTYFFLSKTAVPVFVMISGVTMVDKRYSYGKCFRRIGKLLLTLAVFSAVYYLYYAWDPAAGALAAGTSLKGYFLLTYQLQVTNSFWYLYMYLGILVMLPILQRLAGALDQKDLGYFLLVSLVLQGTIPVLYIWFPWLRHSGHFIIPLFNAFLGMLMGGVYLQRYSKPGRRGLAAALAAIFGGIAVSVGVTVWLYGRNGSGNYLWLDDQKFSTIVLPAMGIFYVFKNYYERWKLPVRARRWIGKLGALTFGGYLLSDLAIKELYFVYQALAGVMPDMIAMVLYEIVVFAVSLFGAFLISKIPKVRELIR